MASTCWKRNSCQTTCSYGTSRSAATARSRSTIVARPFGDRLAKYAAVGSVCGAWTSAATVNARDQLVGVPTITASAITTPLATLCQIAT